MIPTYNQASILDKAIESAVEQDYANLTVIVADDCSMDATRELVNSYVDRYPERIVYKRNDINVGRVGNYHKCLYEHADADWVVNLDGDDYYTDRQFITHAMDQIMQAGPTETLFYQGAHIWKRGNETNDFTFQMPENKVILQGNRYVDQFYNLRYFSHMSTVYNRRLAMESGFYELDIISSDLYSFLRLCITNPGRKVILSKRPTGYWMHAEANASRTKSLRKNLDNVKMYGKLFKAMNRNGWKLVDSTKWTGNAVWHYLYAYLFC